MSTWDQTFRAISGGNRAEFGGDFSSPFGLGVVDLIPTKNPQPYVPSDPSPPHMPSGFGFSLSDLKNPFAATPGATPEEQKAKDKALLVKVALGGAGLLALLAVLGGPKPISVPTATAPTPRPGNINIRLDRITSFGRKKKK